MKVVSVYDVNGFCFEIKSKNANKVVGDILDNAGLDYWVERLSENRFRFYVLNGEFGEL